MAASDEPTSRARRRAGGPATVVLTVQGPVTLADVPRLCRDARARLADVEPGTPVVCDVGGLGPPGTVALEALARLQLTARRLGHRVRLRGASPELTELLERAGWCEVVAPVGDSVVEAQREVEQREEPGGVEEGGQPHDPSL